MWQHCSLSAVQRQTAPIADSILVSDRTDLSSFATHGDEYDLICLIVICVSLWLRKQRCAEKDSLCGQGHDGLNLTCLDQCHGVRSWHKFLPRLTQKNCFLYSLSSKFDP